MSMIGMGANIIGGELQGWASLLDKWAMQDAFKSEANTQKGFADSAMTNFNTNLPSFGSDAAKTDIASGASNRMTQYQQQQAVPLTPGKQAPTSGFVPASLGVTNRAAAGVGGYQDWQFALGQKEIEQQRTLNQIINFAKGDANNVFPYQMYQAQHSNDDLAAIGQAISSIGGTASNYGQLFGSSPTGSAGVGGGGFGMGGTPDANDFGGGS